jgi:DNA mismatch endonuclease, patch repair protein
MDILSKAQRSALMSRVRSKNTKPEMIVRRLLHAMGYRYRLHSPDLPGRPDIVLPRYRTAILVHGCFWHACPHCKKGSRLPVTHASFWASKIAKNVHRDAQAKRRLKAEGWRVIVLWECQTKRETTLLTKLRPLIGQSLSRRPSRHAGRK